VITLESAEEAMVEAAKEFLLGCIPPGAVLHVGEDDDLRGREGEKKSVAPAAAAFTLAGATVAGSYYLGKFRGKKDKRY
jgi:hypothetical protein